VTAPRATYSPDPEYSEEARKENYQGAMQLGLTVSAEGKPVEVCIEQGLGSGLDQKALATVREWRFAPGTEAGRPVPVRINVEIEFKLY
jgi:protein TonB